MDGQTAFSSLDRVCILCSAVKMKLQVKTLSHMVNKRATIKISRCQHAQLVHCTVSSCSENIDSIDRFSLLLLTKFDVCRSHEISIRYNMIYIHTYMYILVTLVFCRPCCNLHVDPMLETSEQWENERESTHCRIPGRCQQQLGQRYLRRTMNAKPTVIIIWNKCLSLSITVN